MNSRIRLVAALILGLGLCAAALIYLVADERSPAAVRYEIVNGEAYPVAPGDSKMYEHELERAGGKAAVLFAEFDRWFAGLWQGRSLALTVAVISIAASAGLFLVAARVPADEASVRNDKHAAD